MADVVDTPTIAKLQIEKLRGKEDWLDWLRDLKLMLRSRDWYEYAFDESGIRASTTTWRRTSMKVSGLIGMHISRQVQDEVPGIEDMTAKELLDALSAKYQTRDDGSRLEHKMRFYALRMNPDETIGQWAARVEREALRGKNIGEDLTHDVASLILYGVTNTFEVIQTMLMRDIPKDPDGSISKGQIVQLLINEESRQHQRNGPATAAAAQTRGSAPRKQYNKNNFTCFTCGQKGVEVFGDRMGCCGLWGIHSVDGKELSSG